MNYYRRALALHDETRANRRHLHRHPEVGLNLPETVKFVTQTLTEYGLSPQPCGKGVTALLGQDHGPTILLRADMDALPIREESGEPFASENGAMHACGHDLHTAMLLTAARMLKETEASLPGRVKLMFQPGEEIFQGAENMISAGILSDPVPDAALGFHVAIGKTPPGQAYYNSSSAMMNSVDGFKLTIRGVGSHGACPNQGVDPINIAVHIYQALQALIAREANPTHTCVLTVGQLSAGSAPNIIPGAAIMQGTLRTDRPKAREQLLPRIRQVAEQTAALFRGSVEYESLSAVPPLLCDPALTEELAGAIASLSIPNFQLHPGAYATASEDFALVAQRIPSAFFYLTAGFDHDGEQYPIHHPKARFNEDVLPLGAACAAGCAAHYLQTHSLK